MMSYRVRHEDCTVTFKICGRASSEKIPENVELRPFTGMQNGGFQKKRHHVETYWGPHTRESCIFGSKSAPL